MGGACGPGAISGPLNNNFFCPIQQLKPADDKNMEFSKQLGDNVDNLVRWLFPRRVFL